MPESMTPEQFALSLEQDGPSVSLHGVTVSDTNGWSVLNRSTLIVVDGPGDEGFLLPRRTSPAGDLAPDGWDAAVSASSAVMLVLAGTRLEADVLH